MEKNYCMKIKETHSKLLNITASPIAPIIIHLQLQQHKQIWKKILQQQLQTMKINKVDQKNKINSALTLWNKVEKAAEKIYFEAKKYCHYQQR